MSDGNEQLPEDVETLRRGIRLARWSAFGEDEPDKRHYLAVLDRLAAALSVPGGGDDAMTQSLRHGSGGGDENERLRAAVKELLADDDMPNHWDDCVCSYCARYRAVVAALRAALRKYGRHDERCARYQHDFRIRFSNTEPTCLCGFGAALAEGEPATETTS